MTSPPRPLTERVLDLYAAVIAGDAERVGGVLAPDVVLHVPGTHPLSGEHHGPDGFLAFLAASNALTESSEVVEVIDVLEGAEHVAVYCRVSARRAGRPDLDNTTIHLLRVVDDRVSAVWFHNRDDIAVDRFWSA